MQLFISNDKPNCSGLILAGSADFKTELSQSDMFDPRYNWMDCEYLQTTLVDKAKLELEKSIHYQ